jgi:hypothetical protein
MDRIRQTHVRGREKRASTRSQSLDRQRNTVLGGLSGSQRPFWAVGATKVQTSGGLSMAIEDVILRQRQKRRCQWALGSRIGTSVPASRSSKPLNSEAWSKPGSCRARAGWAGWASWAGDSAAFQH